MRNTFVLSEKKLKLAKMLQEIVGEADPTYLHAIRGVRTNGTGRKCSLSDCLDDLDEKIYGKILETEKAAREVSRLIEGKRSVIKYMDQHNLTRCPDCLIGVKGVYSTRPRKQMEWEDRNTCGEMDADGNTFIDCPTCDGDGVY